MKHYCYQIHAVTNTYHLIKQQFTILFLLMLGKVKDPSEKVVKGFYKPFLTAMAHQLRPEASQTCHE